MRAKVSINKVRSLLVIAAGAPFAFAGISIYRNDEKFYKNILMPAVHQALNPEDAHRFAIWCAKKRLVPHQHNKDLPIMKTTVMGLEFNNPIGLAAGFDKDGEAVYGIGNAGFGFVEVGSVTPQPQPGNPKPRVFRLTEDEGVINRYGFNSAGHAHVYDNIKATTKCKPIVIGINLGKNKSSSDAVKDYVDGIKMFGEIADYLVINVSSPNTPGLRSLQHRKQLEQLLDEILLARNAISSQRKPPLLLKIAPDLTAEDKKDIAAVVTRKNKVVDGLIVSNTTVQRPSTLKSKFSTEEGGLSGKPLKDLSTSTIREMYKLTEGQIPIIGVGGVFTGEDAYEKIRAGASLIQIYTSLIYEGPPVVNKIKRELENILRKEGYDSVSAAVGADHRK